jgi:hypothetical protein
MADFQEIELPDGSIAEFPLDMSDDEIKSALAKESLIETKDTGPTAAEIDPRTGLAIKSPETPESQARQKLFIEGVKDIGLGPAELAVKGFKALAPEGSAFEESSSNVVKDLAKRGEDVRELEDKTPGGTTARITPGVLALSKLSIDVAPAWLAKAKKPVQEAAEEIPSFMEKTFRRAKDIAKTGIKVGAGSAVVGGVQPTGEEDAGANLRNAVTSGEIGLGLGAGLPAAGAAIAGGSKVVKGFYDMVRRIGGSTKEAKERLGRELAEGATDVNAAQADRKTMLEDADAVNANLKKQGIDETYSPNDITNKDVGTASVYEKYATKDTGEQVRLEKLNTLVNRIVKTFKPEVEDVAALGKQAGQKLETAGDDINLAEKVYNNNTKEIFDLKIKPVLDDLGEKNKIVSDFLQADEAFLTKLQNDMQGIPKAKANKVIYQAVINKIDELDGIRKPLYAKRDEVSKTLPVDASPLAGQLTQAAQGSIEGKDVLLSSPAVKLYFNISKKSDQIIPVPNLTLANMHNFSKKLGGEIVSAREKNAGDVAEVLINLKRSTDEYIQNATTQVSQVNPQIGEVLTAPEIFYKETVAPLTKTIDIPGGKIENPVESLMNDLRKGKQIEPNQIMEDYFLKKGEQGKTFLNALVKLDPEIQPELEGYLIDTIKTASKDPDGAFNLTKFNTVMRDYGPALEVMPKAKGQIALIQKELNLSQEAQADLKPLIKGKTKQLDEYVSQRDTALQENTAFFEQQRKDLASGDMAKVAASFNEEPATFINKALKNPDYARRLKEIAGDDPQAVAALQAKVQEEIERRSIKVVGASNGGEGKPIVVSTFLEELAHPSRQELKSLKEIFGEEGVQDILSATTILQREAVHRVRTVPAAESKATEVIGENVLRAGVLAGNLTEASTLNAFSRFFVPLTNRQIIKVAAKARSDPKYAYDLVQKYMEAKMGLTTQGELMQGLNELMQRATVPVSANLGREGSEDGGEDIMLRPRSVPKRSPFKKKDESSLNSVTNKVATSQGLDPEYFHTVFNLESNYGKNTSNPNSTATGIAHFTDGTWKEYVRRYGVKERITLDMKNNPNAQIVMLGYYTKDIQNKFSRVLGRKPTNSELYIGHVLGGSGGARLLRNMDKVMPAKNLYAEDPKVITGNRSLFYSDTGKARTPKGVYNEIKKRYGNKKLASNPYEVASSM